MSPLRITLLPLPLPMATSQHELTSRSIVPLEKLLVTQLVQDLGKNYYHYYVSTALFDVLASFSVSYSSIQSLRGEGAVA
jgi:hypothetical protein